MHRQFMTGSYLGLVGAFIGAVVVPQRDIPQWAVHRPVQLALAALGCAAVAALVILAGRRPGPVVRRSPDPGRSGDQDQARADRVRQ
jgi:hypothetical protein